MKNKNIIFNDDIQNLIDNDKNIIIDYLNDYDININDVNIRSAADDIIKNEYDDLVAALNAYDKKTKYNYIFVDGDLGLWYGRRHATRNFKTLKDAIMFCFEDQNIVFYEKRNTTISLQAVHHDGCNIFKYYKVVNGKKRAIRFHDLIEAYYE